jgi:hypothetical protein
VPRLIIGDSEETPLSVGKQIRRFAQFAQSVLAVANC